MKNATVKEISIKLWNNETVINAVKAFYENLESAAPILLASRFQEQEFKNLNGIASNVRFSALPVTNAEKIRDEFHNKFDSDLTEISSGDGEGVDFT
jgi:hypothetical protein